MIGMLKIKASRHSAFYSPLIATLAGGFLEDVDATYGILQPGETSFALLRDGAAHIIQSAVSSNWKLMERGESELPVHFAQINRRDGFFLASRTRDENFEWKHLEGRSLIADHGAQPMAMLRYAAKCQDVDWSRIQVIDAGTPEKMIAAFCAGTGDYVHLQGPAPQQMDQAGIGYVAASVGEAMPPVAFSSLCCWREFLHTPEYEMFLRAFAKAKEWVRTATPEGIAETLAPFFIGIPQTAVAAAVQRYQAMGCWDGGVEIPRHLYEQSLNVFEAADAIKQRHPYEQVCQ